MTSNEPDAEMRPRPLFPGSITTSKPVSVVLAGEDQYNYYVHDPPDATTLTIFPKVFWEAVPI